MDVMNGWRPADDPKRVIASGTFNGYPVGAVAGLATLDVLERPGTYNRLFADGRPRHTGDRGHGQSGFRSPSSSAAKGPCSRCCSPSDRRKSSTTDPCFAPTSRRPIVFGVEMIKRGLFVSPYEKIYLSLAHTDDHIDRLLQSVEDVLRDVIAKMD